MRACTTSAAGTFLANYKGRLALVDHWAGQQGVLSSKPLAPALGSAATLPSLQHLL